MINRIFRFIELRFSKKKEFYKSLKEILGYTPRKFEYYELALIHKSASTAQRDGTVINNERLEFLGDAILDAIVGDYLYHKFPKENEGFLTQMRSKIVNGDNLSSLARKIGINNFITANVNNPKGKNKIFEDAFEAFIGAIYLDRGFYFAKEFVLKRVFHNYININELKNTDTNYKSQLIEWSQKFKKETVFNTELESENSKLFICNVIIDNKLYGSGKGLSKKHAEQRAAKATLDKVELENSPEEPEQQLDDEQI